MTKTTIIFVFLTVCLSFADAYAQKYFTRNGNVSFYSDAALEKIEAHNTTAASVIDAESGKMEFAVLIKGFQFDKALMQEHFNENYMESSKYPKAVFKGSIVDYDMEKLKADGEYPVTVKGEMTIHGVTKEVEAEGTFVTKDGKVTANSNFDIAVADYDIKIPAVVADNIAKTVQVSVQLELEKME